MAFRKGAYLRVPVPHVVPSERARFGQIQSRWHSGRVLAACRQLCGLARPPPQLLGGCASENLSVAPALAAMPGTNSGCSAGEYISDPVASGGCCCRCCRGGAHERDGQAGLGSDEDHGYIEAEGALSCLLGRLWRDHRHPGAFADTDACEVKAGLPTQIDSRRRRERERGYGARRTIRSSMQCARWAGLRHAQCDCEWRCLPMSECGARPPHPHASATFVNEQAHTSERTLPHECPEHACLYEMRCCPRMAIGCRRYAWLLSNRTGAVVWLRQKYGVRFSLLPLATEARCAERRR